MTDQGNKGEIPKSSEYSLTLPNNKTLYGEEALAMSILLRTSSSKQADILTITDSLYPSHDGDWVEEEDIKKAATLLGSVTKKYLEPNNITLVKTHDPEEDLDSYHIAMTANTQIVLESKDLPKGKIIEGQNAIILWSLFPFNSTHLVSLHDLNPETDWDTFKREIQNTLWQTNLKIYNLEIDGRTYCYVEKKSPLLNLQMIGETLTQSNTDNSIVLSENEYFLLNYIHIPQTSTSLATIIAKSDGRFSSPTEIIALVSKLNSRLAPLSERRDVLTFVGNDELGKFPTLKDAKIIQSPDNNLFLPCSDPGLILELLEQRSTVNFDSNRVKDDITRLFNRYRYGIATPAEKTAFTQMATSIGKNETTFTARDTQEVLKIASKNVPLNSLAYVIQTLKSTVFRDQVKKTLHEKQLIYANTLLPLDNLVSQAMKDEGEKLDNLDEAGKRTHRNNMLMTGFKKIHDIITAGNFKEIIGKIQKNNPNVAEVIKWLKEFNNLKVQDEDGTIYHGLEFLARLATNNGDDKKGDTDKNNETQMKKFSEHTFKIKP